MATTKLKKPKMVPKSVFDDMNLYEFNDYHETNVYRWADVINLGGNNKELYEDYRKWYNMKFTKLGRALS